ncbi:MAG: amino acid permease [Thermoflavifilum sp.]|nr:amino acid permease [Thermoflavifilum sp.]
MFDLITIVISLIIGMGIFKAPSLVAAESHSEWMFFIAWVLGGCIALCGALTYAEIGSRYPVIGGYYKIFAYAYHPLVGFIINIVILVSNAISTAGVALIGAEYFVHAFFPSHLQTAFSQQLVAIFSILLFFLINTAGLKMSSGTQNILTVIKILMMLVLLMALFIGASHPVTNTPISSIQHISWWHQLQMLGAALVAVTFTYEGYQHTINFGAEVYRPGHTIPRAIAISMAVVIPLYLLMNLAYVRIIGFNELAHTPAIAGKLAASIFGKMGDQVFSVLLFISVLGYVNVSLLSNPRVIFAMSEDGILPEVFQKRNLEKQILFPALSLFALICIGALVMSNQFSVLLNYSIFLDCIGMATSAATIFVLRKQKKADVVDPYIMKAYPWVPAFFILSYVGISIAIAIKDIRTVFFSILLAIVCAILYIVLKKLAAEKS